MCAMTQAGNTTHHLVYVRRKLESEPLPGHATSLPTRGPDSGIPPVCSTVELSHKEVEVDAKDSQASPISDSPQLENNCKSLASSHVNCVVASATTLDHDRFCWEARVCQLNRLLMKLDRSDQKGYIEMLSSLSSIELSKHAFELEKRSIQLSLDEVKELQRVQVLDVLERYSRPPIAPTDQNLSEN